MRKKLFAVIMSAMMMITFMPTMAFAAEGWADDNSYYENASNAKFYNVHKFIKTNSAWSADELNWDGQVWLGAFSDDGTSLVKGKFLGYDLSAAYPSQVNTTPWPSAKSKFDISEITNTNMYGTSPWTMKDTVLTLNKPSGIDYIVNASNEIKKASKYEVASVKMDGTTNKYYGGEAGTTVLTGVSFKITAPVYDEDKAYTEDQKSTLYVSPYFNDDTAKANTKYFLNDIPGRDIVIVKEAAKKAADITASDYQLDGKAIAPVSYNGAEHKLTQKTYADITSTYKMLNEKTGKYEDVTGDAVVTNAGTYHFIATAVNAKDSKDTKKTYIDVTVEKCGSALVEFKPAPHWDGADSYFSVAGKFDPKSFLRVNFYEVEDASHTVLTPTDLKAIKKAIKVDEKEIMEWFNAYYDIKVESKYGYQVATIEEKDLSDAEKKELKTKFADLLANYGETVSSTTYNPIYVTEQSANFKVVDDIQFTKAPINKTYKAKKGKLPKNKTFKVAAKAASGSTLVYKVTNGAGKISVNRTSGKVTVKKGLKKGTYKVGVYAVTIDSFDNGKEYWVEDHYTLKIKVK